MKLLEIIRRYRWDLGIAVESEGHCFDNPDWHLHIIKAPFNRWFADPFILDVTEDMLYVLVEELEHKTNKGRLAKLTIDSHSFKLLEVKIILELPTHLSFPAIYRIDNDIYIYPENSASGKSFIYKYDISNDRLQPYCKISDSPLTDAVMLDFNGRNYMFATKIPEQNDNKIIVCESKEKISIYDEIQTICLPDKSARSAGDFIREGNRVIRPAQNCNGGYGVGLVFQEVSCDDNGLFVVRELFRKNPPSGYIGMHTYNSFKGYAVVDLHRRRFPRLHEFLLAIKHLMKN